MMLRGGGKGGVVVGVLFRSGRLTRFIAYFFFFLRHIWTGSYSTFTPSMYFVPCPLVIYIHHFIAHLPLASIHPYY